MMRSDTPWTPGLLNPDHSWLEWGWGGQRLERPERREVLEGEDAELTDESEDGCLCSWLLLTPGYLLYSWLLTGVSRDVPGLLDYNLYWKANAPGEQHPVDLVEEEVEVIVTVE